MNHAKGVGLSMTKTKAMLLCLSWHPPLQWAKVSGFPTVRSKKKDPDQMNDRDPLRRRRPTLPPGVAVPSAQTGLTSLFGMVRGGPRRHGHLNFRLLISCYKIWCIPVLLNSRSSTAASLQYDNDIIKGQFWILVLYVKINHEFFKYKI